MNKYKILLLSFLIISFTTISVFSTNLEIKKDNCIKIGGYIGIISGTVPGMLYIYDNLQNPSKYQSSFIKKSATVLPSIIIGSFAGYSISRWATKKITAGDNSLMPSILKGMAYGSISGAVTLSAGIIPLFTMGYLLDTMNFNSIFPITSIMIVGGIVYGAIAGVMVGALGGGTISFYLTF